MNRRKFIRNSGLIAAGLSINQNISAESIDFSNDPIHTLLKPKALQPGDLIALIAPSGAVFDKGDILQSRKKLEDLGFKVKEGKTLYSQHGYFSDTDENRAKEIMKMFLDPEIKGIISIRGGSGCARLLPHLDYHLIRKHIKPFIGMSDITVLLNAFYLKAGIVSFHGPVGFSTWEGFTWKYFKPTVMEKKKTEMLTPSNNELFYTINSGIAEGELIGGNLTVFSQLVGSHFLPDMKNKILFLEDIKEEPYRIDRLLTQLELAGVLKHLNGIILGEFKKCVPEEPEKSLSLKEMFIERLSVLNIPVFYGAKFGHVRDKWTFPIGVKARMDADKGSVILLEEAVI